MLKLKHVYKKYNKEYILNDINLTLPSKGLVSILGSSGSGKTTLLNIIGGIDKPTSGTISLNNKIINELNNKELDWYHDKYVSFVFQQYNLINYLTVKDNLRLVNNNYEFTLFKLNIYDLKNKKVSELSGGEKQRVALARCLLKNPKLLLCDEPTGALDSTNSIFILDTLKEISKERLVIVITHNEELANTYSDHIIRIKDGKIDNNIIVKERIQNLNVEKVKHKNIFKVIVNHLANKWKRNLLISLSFAIGLISLGLVLSITNGFQASLDKEEKNTLSKYPILISKYSSNVEDELKDNFEGDNNKVYSYDINHINQIDMKYINSLNDINDLLDYKVYKFNVDNYSIINSMINLDKYYDEFDILYGSNKIGPNEVLIMLDSKNRINKYELQSISLFNDDYSYKDFIGYSYTINKVKYSIKGIIRAKSTSIFNESSGIIYDNYNFINNIPDEIYLYPSNYDNKLLLINKLNTYKDIKYQDISTSIKNISNTLIDGIRIVLIVFSIITLVVSSILISILTYINIMEYKHEIGVYKSIGMKNSNIKIIFYLENILLVLLSNIITIVSMLLINIPLNNIIFNLTGLSNVISINLLTITSILSISLLLSLISSSIPIKNISKLNIVDILRNE